MIITMLQTQSTYNYATESCTTVSNYYVLQASIPLTYCGMPILLKKELQQKLDRLVE